MWKRGHKIIYVDIFMAYNETACILPLEYTLNSIFRGPIRTLYVILSRSDKNRVSFLCKKKGNESQKINIEHAMDWCEVECSTLISAFSLEISAFSPLRRRRALSHSSARPTFICKGKKLHSSLNLYSTMRISYVDQFFASGFSTIMFFAH